METKEAFEYFYLLEKEFWKDLEKDKDRIEYITYGGELRPEDMLLYGEFGFVLLGLKPALLIEFRDLKVNRLYLERVVQPVLSSLKRLKYHIIQHVETPETNLHGCIFIYNDRNEEEKVLLLLQSILNNKISPLKITEETMATILDYPGHLPRSEKELSTMKTVIYFHDTPNHGLIALTSFAMQASEQENVLTHFKHYQEICKNRLGIHMKLFLQ
ncbi:uncharacterized protein BX663DRAFT_505105 [Cokeromyces recurvatus]|uniref:uncharacterized protein n=1 Tax=Cokeromyces recurvatus TaxID=90255 RepID=UPI00221FFB62|nr:uncharacterized protein BX663DRAFT_505105 [Cokeromyces recurvatus]KAI7904458.1 hypothetical protein BX663DRAFT_505105 [Cokeromyces recurvatus]